MMMWAQRISCDQKSVKFICKYKARHYVMAHSDACESNGIFLSGNEREMKTLNN